MQSPETIGLSESTMIHKILQLMATFKIGMINIDLF